MSQMDWRQALLRWRIQFRRGTTDAWTSANPVLLLGEPGWDQDLLRMKIGDGVTAWNDLAWASLDPTQLAEILELLEALPDLDDARMTTVILDVSSDFFDALNDYVQGVVDDYIPLAQRGANNGVATLDSGGKIPTSQLPSSAMEFKGNWNASTNSPTLADGTGNAGDQYRVSVAGTRNLGSGSIVFDIGDAVIYSGTIWEKSDNTESVNSVAGKTGVVVLARADVGLNKAGMDSAMDEVLLDPTTAFTTDLNASIDARAVPRSLAPIILDSSYSTTATLDALLATLTSGAVLEIPPGVTINRSTALTLPVPMTIKGDGTLNDTRTSPAGAFITIGPAAAGSKILCRLTGAKAGSYASNHHAVTVQGTDNGASTAPTYVTNVIVKSPEISGFGSLAVFGEFVKDSQFDIDYAHDLGYGGVIIHTAINVSSYIRRLTNVTPGTASESYGIQFDRHDQVTDLVRYPHSQNCQGRIDVIRNCTNIHALGTHGGQGIDLSWGAAYGVLRPIDIVPASGDSNVRLYAPNNVTFRGGYASSGVTDGSGQPAIIIAGAYGTSSVTEYAKGIHGHVGTLVGYGTENDTTSGAVVSHTTQGLDLSVGNARESSPWAVNLYHDNKDFVVRVGSSLDAWTNSGAVAGVISVSSYPNSGWIVSASGTVGSKSATHVNNRGLNVAVDASNVIRLGMAADFSSASTPTAGPLASPYLGPILPPAGSVAAPAYSFAADPDTGLYSVSDGSLGVAVNAALVMRWLTSGILLADGYKVTAGASTTAAASVRLKPGTAPTTPVDGDMWTTTAGLFVRINGATVGPLS